MAAAMRGLISQCGCRFMTLHLKNSHSIYHKKIKLHSYTNYLASFRGYGRRRGKERELDPRKNTQYPYAPGDPLQEDAIQRLKEKSPLADLHAKDKKNDQRKKAKIKEQTSVFQTSSGLKYEKIKEGDIRLGFAPSVLRTGKYRLMRPQASWLATSKSFKSSEVRQLLETRRTILAAKSRQPKKDSETIFLEGQRLIRDALMSGAETVNLYFSEPETLNNIPIEFLQDINLYKIPYRDMKIWSDTVTPSGLIGVFKKPQQGEATLPIENPLPITLIFDSLKDPGNAGTLVRTAAAVGCERILTTKGSANLWESKVLRSAMGGHFRLPIYTGLSWADIPNYLNEGTQVFLANSRKSSILERAFDDHLGSEDVDKVIAMSEISDSDGSDSDSDLDENDEWRMQREVQAEKRAYTFHKVPLAVYDYSEIDLKPASDNAPLHDKDSVNVALVIGGETEGLSALAKKFAYSQFGHYVTVPMSDAVESLNTSIAGSIILYELRRKILLLRNEH